MADAITYDYNKMNQAVETIRAIKEQYKTAGDTFVDSFISSVSEWEGESKDKLVELIRGKVSTMLTTDIPSYLEGLASLLDQNITQMKNADHQIAESIQSSMS